MTDMKNLRVRYVSIFCKAHPEWGTYGVFDDHRDYYYITNGRNSRILPKDEAAEFWAVVE